MTGTCIYIYIYIYIFIDIRIHAHVYIYNMNTYTGEKGWRSLVLLELVDWPVCTLLACGVFESGDVDKMEIKKKTNCINMIMMIR